MWRIQRRYPPLHFDFILQPKTITNYPKLRGAFISPSEPPTHRHIRTNTQPISIAWWAPYISIATKKESNKSSYCLAMKKRRWNGKEETEWTKSMCVALLRDSVRQVARARENIPPAIDSCFRDFGFLCSAYILFQDRAKARDASIRIVFSRTTFFLLCLYIAEPSNKPTFSFIYIKYSPFFFSR